MATSNDDGLGGGSLPNAISITPIDLIPLPAPIPGPIPAPTLIFAPSNLQASAAPGAVTLTWQDNSNNEDGFRIRRRGPNEADFTEIAQVGRNVTAYVDTTVQPQKTYTYRVRAFLNSGGGAASNDATVTTPPATPAVNQRREIRNEAKGSTLNVVAGKRRSFIAGQFELTVGGIPTLEFVNASATINPAHPTTSVSIFPANPIETFQDVTLTFNTTVDTPVRTYDIVLKGQSTDVPGSAGAYPTTTFKIDVLQAPIVNLSIAPASRTIRAGESATYDVTLQRNPAAEGEEIELEVNTRILPAGVTATLEPTKTRGNKVKLTVNTDRALLPADTEMIELRVRKNSDAPNASDVTVNPATATLRLRPEVSFTASPMKETVVRGGTKRFTFTANRLYYKGQLGLRLTARDPKPTFTPTIQPSGISNASQFEVDIKISENTQPRTYTFVATPRYPQNVTDAVPMETPVELEVQDTAATTVTVGLSDATLNVPPGNDDTLNLGVASPMNFAGMVDVTLDLDRMPFGVTVSPTQLVLSGNSAQTVTIEAAQNATGGDFTITPRGTVRGTNAPVKFQPMEVRVNVPFDNTVIATLRSPGAIDMGDPATFVIDVRSVGYDGEIRATYSAPGESEDVRNPIDLDPGDSGTIIFEVQTMNLQPDTYTFPVSITATPGADISMPVQTATLVVRSAAPTPGPAPGPAPAPTLAAPTDLRATLQGQQVNLRWNDNSEEDGFRIERRTMQSAYQTIATVGRGTTSFADATVAQGVMVFYRVKAFAGALESAPSNEIGASVPLPQPAAASVRLSAAPSTQRIAPGSIASFSVALARTNFTGPVDLTVDGLPFGAIATFSDDPATGNSSILTIATTEIEPGLYPLNVRGTAPNVNVQPATITLISQPRIPLPFPRPIGGRDLRPGFSGSSADLDT